MATTVTRRLVLVRHAKSARPHGVPDHDRPLTGRGRRDAQEAGLWFATEGPRPGMALCSTAVRARHTWELALLALRQDVPTRIEPLLYGADAVGLLSLAASAPPSVTVLVVVGHEPTMSETTLALTGRGPDRRPDKRTDRRALAAVTEKFATCGIAVVRFEGEWAGLPGVRGVLESFTVPRG